MSLSDVTLESVYAARKMLSCSSPAAPSSSNAQLRKIKKPLIERRRRERINECLGQLKALVLEATNKDESRYSKMEKADILEMTVAHLKVVHNAKRLHCEAGRRACHAIPAGLEAPVATDDAASGATTARYLMGYNECVREVASYLTADAGSAPHRLGDDVRTALMRHLDDALRLRACCAPVVGALRLQPSSQPADTTAMRLQIDAQESNPSRQLLGLHDVDAMSPSSSVDCVAGGDTPPPRRLRCDSGVYSSASSPAQADELAAAAPMPCPLELTTRPRDSAMTSLTTTIVFPDCSRARTLDCSISAEPWRPW